jgi:hypothetical protein
MSADDDGFCTFDKSLGKLAFLQQPRVQDERAQFIRLN